MNILKIFKSNAFIFFIVALVLLSYSVHTMGSRKNSILDTFKGNGASGNFSDYVGYANSNKTDSAGRTIANGETQIKSAPNKDLEPMPGMGKNNPKPVQQPINPSDLLPSDGDGKGKT